MRICLIGDTHGFVPGLEAALLASKRHAPDLIVHCGDFPDVAVLPRSAGRNDRPAALGERPGHLRQQRGVLPRLGHASLGSDRRRASASPRFARLLPVADSKRGRPSSLATDLAWLRALPGELSLDGARQGDVYVCHGMPGNPFATIWDTDPAFTPDFTAEEIDSALSRKAVASADLILCGHTPGPTLLRIALPNGQAALVVRSSGHLPGDGPGPGTRASACSRTAAARSPASPAGASSSNGRPSSRATRSGRKPVPSGSAPVEPNLRVDSV